MRESTLNKIGAFSLNPRLRWHRLNERLVVLVGGDREGAAIVFNRLDLGRAMLCAVARLSVTFQEMS